MAVPVAAKAARSVTRALLAAGADRPETAQPLDGLSPPRRRALQRLLRQGVVCEEGGRYWLDAVAYERWNAMRLLKVLWMLMVMVVAMAGLVILGMFRG